MFAPNEPLITLNLSCRGPLQADRPRPVCNAVVAWAVNSLVSIASRCPDCIAEKGFLEPPAGDSLVESLPKIVVECSDSNQTFTDHTVCSIGSSIIHTLGHAKVYSDYWRGYFLDLLTKPHEFLERVMNQLARQKHSSR